ncbi:MAG: hypothetical protein JRJ86_13060 [Deltaproteobacteria bacterium]|nr:hypothetical protein [Deltaproteobacteria bacterium]MBW2116794.1 hypothetical protein [Deltaproteobacteria bacterium]MBW2345028.1 hypothetical protein [Deltaproteobacteria bacterium]
MKDDLGKYYYPFPQEKKVRMYVQEEGNEVFFRLWNSDAPELWDEHGWIPYEAIKQAEAMYDREKDFKPNEAYNLEIAKAVLKEDS